MMEKVKSADIEVRKPEEMSIVRDNRTLTIYDGSIQIDRFLEPINYELSTGIDCNLNIVEPFSFPAKMYDIDKTFREQILRTFHNQNRNVGVLYEGYKGMGKSVDAKLLCKEANLPVVLITSRIPQQIDFVSFINGLKTDLVVFIDEFEKLFPHTYQSDQQDGFHSQESFLGFMDGAIGNKYKRLFVLTTNDQVNDKLINRPSRVRYYKRYNQMNEEVYNMIIEDKLINKKFEQDLRDNLTVFDCTVDLLTTIIEEMNIHNIPYSQFKQIFNHKPNLYRYERWVQDKTGRWQFLDFFDTSRKIERDDTNINGAYHCRIIDVKDDYIIYTTFENTKSEEEDTWEKVEKTYKLKEINSNFHKLYTA